MNILIFDFEQKSIFKIPM